MSTDFSYGGKQIVSGGPFKPSGKDMPSDARTRVESYADIASIPNPYVGLKITVKVDETNSNEMTDYIVKSLKANSAGIPNMAIDEVVKYVDYLGVSAGGGSGEGLTSTQKQHLQTAYEHSQSSHVQASDLLNIDAVSLNGKKISGPMTKDEYDTISDKDPNTIYLVDDVADNAIEGIPSYGSAEANKVLAVNSNGTALAWVDAPSGSGSGLTTEQTQQLTTAYNHSQSPHVSSSDIPTKVSQLDNDSQYVTTTELNEAISGIGTGEGGSTYDDTELKNSKYDDVSINSNQLTFSANGNTKKTITLPTTAGDGTAINDNTTSTSSTWSSSKISEVSYKDGSDPQKLIGIESNGAVNLFNKNAVINGSYLNGFGNALNKEGKFVSDYIPVISGQTYSVNYMTNDNIGLYDSDKKNVKTEWAPTKVTIPEGVAYVRLSAPLKTIDSQMFCLGTSLPSDYVEYVGDLKYNFNSTFWDFDAVDSLITKDKLDVVINGENQTPYIYSLNRSGLTLETAGNSARAFLILVFDLTEIKSLIQNSELLYYNFDIKEEGSSLINTVRFWVNYQEKSTSASNSLTKQSDVHSLSTGTINNVKGNMDVGFTKDVNNYLNVAMLLTSDVSNSGSDFNISLYKPAFTMGGIDLGKYLVGASIQVNVPSTKDNILYYTDETYTRHKDMVDYIKKYGSEEHSKINSKITELYSLVGSGSAGGSGSSTTVSKWMGKKVSFLGDSITAQGKDYDYGFFNLLNAEKHFSFAGNGGVPSSTIVEGSIPSNAICNRYANTESDVDLIVVFGGINDLASGCAFGEFGSTDKTTVYGSINALCQGLQTKYPGARKLICTSLKSPDWKKPIESWGNKNQSDWNEAIKEVCKYYSIPVLDLFSEGLETSIPAVVTAYYNDAGIHPNAKGHRLLADMIGARIEQI